MRILCLSSWWPEPADNGSRLRIANLLRALAERHEVHLLALAQEPVTEAQRRRLEQISASVDAVLQPMRPLRGTEVIASLWQPEPASVRARWNPEFAALVQAHAAAIQPAVVVAFQLGVAPYARTMTGVPRILEELEVTPLFEQYSRQRPGLRRLRAWLTWQKHRSYVARVLGEFDGYTAVSQAEVARIQTLVSARTPGIVIPNGADVAGCTSYLRNPEPDTLIYPGALSFDANLDAMAYFLTAIFPRIKLQRPSVRLLITGKTTPEQRAALPQVEGVEFTGYVPDVRPVVARAWAEVVPLRIGGGTRLKVLEALALGTPVVSTSKGVEGLDLTPDQHVLVADSPKDFAAATIRLLEDPCLRARLSAAGLQVVRERYDWHVIGQQLLGLIGAHAVRSAPAATFDPQHI